MLWNIAWRSLLEDRGKMLAAVVGVVFSIVLVNVQGGLFIGLIRKATLLVDRGHADIWVGHKGMRNVDFPHQIPERWLHRVLGVPGVVQAQPIRVGYSEMQLPNGAFESVVVIGVRRNTSLGHAYCTTRDSGTERLLESDSLLIDGSDLDRLGFPAVGDAREIGRTRFAVTGHSSGTVGLVVTPYVFVDYDQSVSCTSITSDEASYFLIQTAEGVDKKRVCQQINQRLRNAAAMTTEEYASVSINFWMTRTGIGLSFGAATFLGLLVGLVMVGQTLYAMVLDRISEFATLKAIGATEREIVALLIAQSSVVAGVGIAIGVVLTFVIRLLFSSPRAAIEIPLSLYLGSAVLVFVICLAASALPYLRVRRVDPHSALQG